MSEIKVPPEELKARADAAANAIRQMQDRFSELGDIIRRTSYYWIGDAGNQHRKMYLEQEKTRGEIMQRLSRHPDNLLKIAGIFQESEKKSVENVIGLPTDLFK